MRSFGRNYARVDESSLAVEPIGQGHYCPLFVPNLQALLLALPFLCPPPGALRIYTTMYWAGAEPPFMPSHFK